MLSVRLITDPFDLAAYREVAATGVSLLSILQTEFPTWPETARLYKDAVAVENDVTPTTEAQADDLEATTDGIFYVVVYPGDPVTAIVTIVATLAITAAVLLFLMPQINGPGTDAESANNSLGSRSNKARPNSRIPDIFGEVISIPELLTVPLLTFEDNLEVEICYMCIGRGAYEVSELKDGDTPLTMIAGAGAEVYAPFTSPNSGPAQLAVGSLIDVPLRSVVKLNEVNGQQLDAPNSNVVHGDGDIRFVAPNFIQNNSGIDFTESFGAGDVLSVASANFGSAAGAVLDPTTQDARFYPDKTIEFASFDPSTLYSAGQLLTIANAGFAGVDGLGNVIYIDVSGTYEIQSVTSTTIVLVP